jgi:hypothetical protein
MASKQTDRARKAGRLQPSSEDRAKAAELVRRLTPSPAAYQEYRDLVDFSLLASSMIRAHPSDFLRSLRLRKSKLFEGRQYLIAYVEDDWLSQTHPGCNALCSSMDSPMVRLAEGKLVPPLVMLPASKCRARSAAFSSLVEHEIVHINQVILGFGPGLPTGRHAEHLLEYLIKVAEAEYEASFIQNVLQPEPIPKEHMLSLDHWCVLNGYAQALERVLATIVKLGFSPEATERFLDSLESALRDLLRRIHASDEVVLWFLNRTIAHVFIAVQQVLAQVPDSKDHPGFRATGSWLRRRVEAGATHQSGGDR